MDPMTPGVLTDCHNIIPTLNGFKSGPSLSTVGIPSLSFPCIGASLVVQLDNERRIFAGTSTRIYELTGTTWTNRSKSGGYTPGAENRWRFCQFGNVTIATNQTDKIQFLQAGGGAFADIADAPIAKIVLVASGFVMAFSIGSDTQSWACSGLYNYNTWTPSQATQAATGQIVDSPGDIRAAKALGNSVVVYKERSMYLGTYVGPPVIWQWEQISSDIGAVGPEAVVNIGTEHIFIGSDDFWVFDGSRPVAFNQPIKNWFFSNSSRLYRSRANGYYDRFNNLIYFYYCSVDSGGDLDSCIVYNTKTKLWGRSDRKIQAPLEFTTIGMIYDELGDVYNEYDDIPNFAYDSDRWYFGGYTAAIFDDQNQLMFLDGIGSDSYIETWDIGDDSQYSTLLEVRPRFTIYPATAYMQQLYKNNSGSELFGGPFSNLNDGKFDTRWSSRWHKTRMYFSGDVELSAIKFTISPDGKR